MAKFVSTGQPIGSSGERPLVKNERLVKAVLAITIAASSFTIQIFLPALPTVQSAFDVTATQVQLTISLPTSCDCIGYTSLWAFI